MFSIEMLPAQRGDCLWLTYGQPDELHHLIVDGGPQETIQMLVPELTRRIRSLGDKDCVELLVITHVDVDHIQGVTQLLVPSGANKWFRDIWFNGYHHLGDGILGGRQGEQLTTALNRAKGRWNKAFCHKAVVIPDEGDLPTKQLNGGMKLTLLSPTKAKLAKMVTRWDKDCARAGLIPGEGLDLPKPLPPEDGILGGSLDDLAASKFSADPEPPNGSSIAFIAEYEGKRVLLGADAHAPVLLAALKRLGSGPYDFAAVKVPHHGSKKNLSFDLANAINCKCWLFSSNGALFHHPNAETIARIVKAQPTKPTLYFNYLSNDNERWKTGPESDRYRTKYPAADKAGIKIEL